jgi:hypothetical protein
MAAAGHTLSDAAWAAEQADKERAAAGGSSASSTAPTPVVMHSIKGLLAKAASASDQRALTDSVWAPVSPHDCFVYALV